MSQDLECPAYKQAGGSSPCPNTCFCRTFLEESYSSEGSLKPGQKQDIFTGRSASDWLRRAPSVPSTPCLGTPSTPSPLGLPPLSSTVGKKILESPEPSSNLDRSPIGEMIPPVGKRSGSLPKKVKLKRSIRMYEWFIIVPCDQLLRILQNRLEWSELAMYSGAELVVESRGVLGKKPERTLMLKIPKLNFGAVTGVNRMLLSMNFEVQSELHTYCDGWIDIQCAWKLKDHQCLCKQVNCGSPPISIPNLGIQI